MTCSALSGINDRQSPGGGGLHEVDFCSSPEIPSDFPSVHFSCSFSERACTRKFVLSGTECTNHMLSWMYINFILSVQCQEGPPYAIWP